MTDTPVERGGESTWARLRRRKVVQWGLVYAAAAWGFLQGLEYLSGTYDWPRQIQQLTTLALLVGLPIVLVLAWYHGDRGEQRVRGTELAIITLLFLLGGAIFWWYERAGETSTPAAVTADVSKGGTTPADPRPSIAVLPFENRSDVEKDAFFVDGIHDDILTQLAKIGSMRVIARTSVEPFRDTKLTTREIAEQLGVTKLLEGGVQRAGDRVRVTVQLIDAANDAHVWAENYDRELTAANIFAIQSEVATAIAGALRTALTPAEQARAQAVPTQNLEAWEAYQLGQQRMAKRTNADLSDAERFFREAISRDPKFALAYLGLADAVTLQLDYGGGSLESNLSTAEKAVAEALRLDPNLAEAWASSGLIASYRSQIDRAESMYRRAIELNPNYATVHHWYGFLLRNVGRLDDALVQQQRAVELDPLSVMARVNLGAIQEALGRFPEAEAAYRKAIEIDPSRPAPFVYLAMMNALSLNRFAAAVPLARKSIELDPSSTNPRSLLAALYFDLGDDARFTELTLQASKRWPDDSWINFQSALVYLLRKDPAAAIRHAQRAYEQAPTYREALAILANADVQNGRYDAALERYQKAFPELFVQSGPRFDGSNYGAAIDLALIARQQGDGKRMGELLDGAERVIRKQRRLGNGYGVSDVQILAVRGERNSALKKLREAEQAGWRVLWRYYRDFDPALASIRNEPEFKAIFADIERDMARQRAALAARPKDAPLDLGATGT
jgi:TolB-like protein/Flp pilus assembly protein TadD